ncbi:MAG: zinc-binding alcohol dehydrogenase/oxidoreductase [Gammaproteobacteria bacterium]|jgi:zinc-binding alcohol dehydrogenase/oxidoreductase
MKAIVLEKIGGPENLMLKEVETPKPGAGEVRVAIKASALNRRDLWITIGLYPGIQLPCITGSDAAGVIDMIGEGVDASLLNKEVVIYPALGWGDNPRAYGPEFRVLGMPEQGTFAEFICIPAENVFEKPAHLNWEQAAAIPVAGITSWRSVITQGEIEKGHRVLITGAGGGVASFALLWCINLGADVYVSSGNEDKLNWAKGLGAIDGVNYNEKNCYKELSKRVGGFDVIIDSSGGDSMNELLGSLKHAGRYIFFGATNMNPSAGLEMAKLFFRHIRIQGTTMGTAQEFSEMMDFINKNKIVPVIDQIFSLDQVVDAHRLMENYSQTGKIILNHENA